MRVAVTGSTGKLGRATVARLIEDGHEVSGLDLAGPAGPGFTRVDLADYGQTLDALLGVTARHEGFDAIVHLAAIPVNGLVPDVTTFHNNVAVTFNVLHAALRAGIDTVVTASSITAMGFPFDEAPPSLPVDESFSRAHNTYGLGKVVEEAMEAQLVGWRDRLSITALRFTNVVGDGEYDSFERADDPAYRRDLLWSYIDARDGALAVSLALEHARPGFEAYVIAASDTGSAIPSARLAADAFPDVPITRELGEFETLLSIDKARRCLGFEPRHLWRDEVRAAAGRSR
ncbi:NAD-dependent epimerase/dehydratase family protein [Planctomonas deserti]|uniref:NAD-dependent epimerase/dehydratase family protein n=1 Tax=Planctomonas deserti TaxID=2144185 RepID=UPI000D36D4EC|nr:NAD(P)-dependent oxidoreductase [Planctomonas deserti]